MLRKIDLPEFFPRDSLDLRFIFKTIQELFRFSEWKFTGIISDKDYCNYGRLFVNNVLYMYGHFLSKIYLNIKFSIEDPSKYVLKLSAKKVFSWQWLLSAR